MSSGGLPQGVGGFLFLFGRRRWNAAQESLLDVPALGFIELFEKVDLAADRGRRLSRTEPAMDACPKNVAALELDGRVSEECGRSPALTSASCVRFCEAGVRLKGAPVAVGGIQAPVGSRLAEKNEYGVSHYCPRFAISRADIGISRTYARPGDEQSVNWSEPSLLAKGLICSDQEGIHEEAENEGEYENTNEDEADGDFRQEA